MISAINFLSDYCNGTKLIVRLDDDVILNPTKMLSYLHHFLTPSNSAMTLGQVIHWLPPKTIWCPVLSNFKIIRCPRQPYCVGGNVLPGRIFYPRFCAGYFMAITGDLPKAIQHQITVVKPFWIDDRWFGIIQENLKTTTIDIGKGGVMMDVGNSLYKWENRKKIADSVPAIATRLNSENDPVFVMHLSRVFEILVALSGYFE